jgi:hypothetical protein
LTYRLAELPGVTGQLLRFEGCCLRELPSLLRKEPLKLVYRVLHGF